MIVVFSALKSKDIIELLHQQDGKFKYVKKKGIELYFETTIEDKEQAANLAGSLIRATSYGKSISFQTAGCETDGEVRWHQQLYRS